MGLLSYAFNSYPPKELGLLVNTVITNTKTDDRFESLKPECLILENAYTPFWNAYTDALKGGVDRRDLRDNLQVPLLVQTNKFAHLVEALVGKNAALAQASGFKTIKTGKAAKTTVKALTPPTKLKITNVDDKLGWATFSWSGSEGSKSYDVEIRILGDAEWSVAKHTTKQSIDRKSVV